MLLEHKTPACLPSSHFSEHDGPCMDGRSKDGEGRESLANPPLTVPASPGPLSLFSPFFRQNPGLLLILCSFALNISSKKPRTPGVSFSLMYKLIFASEPPTDPLFLPMCTESKGRRKTVRGSTGRFLSFHIFVRLYNNQKVGCLLGITH